MASESRRPTAAGTDVDQGEAPADLAGVVFSGVLWKALTRGVSEATRVAVVLVLARLLTPEEYGVAGMALVVASFGVILTDPALGAALIQRPTIDERDRSTVFWLAVALGTGLTVAGVAASPLVADVFGEPEVQGLFAASSLVFVVIGLAVAPRALLTRRLAYRTLELREMAAIVVGGATAIGLAAAGAGPWAIVGNLLAAAAVSTVLAWFFVGWRPRARFSAQSARALGGFSSRVFAAGLLDWGNQNVDKALVGRFVGAAALGAYSLAWSTMRMPVTLVSGTLHAALTPAYSRIQRDRERLERVWLQNKRLSYGIIAPALATVAVAAPDLVPVLLGKRWEDAVTPLQLLCVGALASALGALNWSLLQARGETRALLRLTLMTSAGTWTAFAIGVRWGIVGVALAYAIARWLLVVPATFVTARGAAVDFRAALTAGTPILPLVAASAGVAVVVQEALAAGGVSAPLRLVAVPPVFALVYLGLVFVALPSLPAEVRRLLVRRYGNSTPEVGG